MDGELRIAECELRIVGDNPRAEGVSGFDGQSAAGDRAVKSGRRFDSAHLHNEHPQVGLPLEQAQRLARILARRLAPACARLEVAGSIRRGKAWVKDVELVAIPRAGELDALLARLEREGDEGGRRIYRSRAALEERLAGMGLPFVHVPDVRRWGERYKRFYVWSSRQHGIVAVDLFLATRDNWGAIFAIRTGPGDFSQALVTHLKSRTPYRQQDGQVVVQATGAVVPVPEEADYFALAGLPVIPPERRTVAELRRALAEARRAGMRPAPPPDLKSAPGVEYPSGGQLALPL